MSMKRESLLCEGEGATGPLYLPAGNILLGCLQGTSIWQLLRLLRFSLQIISMSD